MENRTMDNETIGVAGMGLLGRGIAACLLAHGFRVVAYTTGDDTHERARGYIGEAIQELIAKAGFPESLAGSWPQNYVQAESLADFAPCGFVIESVVEDLAIKQQVFEQIEGRHRRRRSGRQQHLGAADHDAAARS